MADFIAASISHCRKTVQASALYFWWASKREIERYNKPTSLQVLKST